MFCPPTLPLVSRVVSCTFIFACLWALPRPERLFPHLIYISCITIHYPYPPLETYSTNLVPKASRHSELCGVGGIETPGARLYFFFRWMWDTLSALTVQLFLMWRVYKKSNTKHLLQIKTAIHFWLVVCDLNHFLETPYTAIVVSSNVTPCWRYEGSRSRVRQICKVFIGRLWNTKWRNGTYG